MWRRWHTAEHASRVLCLWRYLCNVYIRFRFQPFRQYTKTWEGRRHMATTRPSTTSSTKATFLDVCAREKRPKKGRPSSLLQRNYTSTHGWHQSEGTFFFICIDLYLEPFDSSFLFFFWCSETEIESVRNSCAPNVNMFSLIINTNMCTLWCSMYPMERPIYRAPWSRLWFL